MASCISNRIVPSGEFSIPPAVEFVLEDDVVFEIERTLFRGQFDQIISEIQ